HCCYRTSYDESRAAIGEGCKVCILFYCTEFFFKGIFDELYSNCFCLYLGQCIPASCAQLFQRTWRPFDYWLCLLYGLQSLENAKTITTNQLNASAMMYITSFQHNFGRS